MLQTPPTIEHSAYVIQSFDEASARTELCENGHWCSATDPVAKRSVFNRAEAAAKLLELGAAAPARLYAVVEIDLARTPGDPERVGARII